MPLSTSPYQQQGQSKAIAIIILVILAITLAVTVALFGPKEVKKAFYTRSIGDAAESCEEEIIDYFDDRIISKHYDDISSRYEANMKQYTVYYRVSHTEMVNELPTVEYSMAKCVVWESLGYVSEFRVFKP